MCVSLCVCGECVCGVLLFVCVCVFVFVILCLRCVFVCVWYVCEVWVVCVVSVW